MAMTNLTMTTMMMIFIYNFKDVMVPQVEQAVFYQCVYVSIVSTFFKTVTSLFSSYIYCKLFLTDVFV